MSFQSGKTTTETVLNFPRRAGSASLAPSTGASLLPVLIVLHQETSTPGRVGPRPDRILSGPSHARGAQDLRQQFRATGKLKSLAVPVIDMIRPVRQGTDFPVEAFQFDNSFGFQFHPEVTYAMMHRWTTHGHERLELPGARPRHHHFADRAVHDVAERAWLKQFIERWLARVPLSVLSEAAE